MRKKFKEHFFSKKLSWGNFVGLIFMCALAALIMGKPEESVRLFGLSFGMFLASVMIYFTKE